MFSAARTALRPKSILTRSLAARAASVHTLPPLPYAYNVRTYFNEIPTPTIFLRLWNLTSVRKS
jgi:hypothetical protein